MIELAFTNHYNTGNYKSLHGVELLFNSSLAKGIVASEVLSENIQQETFSLKIDDEGFFSIIVDSQPIDLFIDGNLLIEAENPEYIRIFEYIWNPISKILTGRVQI